MTMTIRAAVSACVRVRVYGGGGRHGYTAGRAPPPVCANQIDVARAGGAESIHCHTNPAPPCSTHTLRVSILSLFNVRFYFIIL